MKAVIGTFFSATLLGQGVVHFVVLCAAVASFFAAGSWLVIAVYSILSDVISSGFGSVIDTNTDLFNFVSYVLNFSFMGTFFTFYYIAFCTFVVMYITISVASFVSSIYPHVASFIRSQLNWITGDS